MNPDDVRKIRHLAALKRWTGLTASQRAAQTLPGRTAILRAGRHKEYAGKNLLTHGLTHSPEHRSWLSMMTRCHWSDATRPDYHLYQGAGITVCERWRDFANFLADMGPKPTPLHSIDRVKSSLGYFPGNCRWATSSEQSHNRSDNVWLSLDGRRQILSDWARELGISNATLSERLGKWSKRKALTTKAIRTRLRKANGTFA